jgi:hypothetical protein
MSLGMMLIRANTLAFSLIFKDGPKGIIKICFGNMNLVFGSEVVLLGFWEYMFGILVKVHGLPVNALISFVVLKVLLLKIISQGDSITSSADSALCCTNPAPKLFSQ